MDGTFKSFPKPFYQLYTILAYVNTFYFYIPLVFALLPDKMQSPAAARTYCMDFERAAMNVVEAKFTQSRSVDFTWDNLGGDASRVLDDYRQQSSTTSK